MDVPLPRALSALPIRDARVEVGALQRSGAMAMVPLFTPAAGDRFLPPLGALKLSRVAGYGNVEIECRGDARGVAIVPLHIGYVQDRAQNHALCRSALLCAGQKLMFDDACCVQQGQGGYLEGRDQGFFVLPVSLRHEALLLRGQKGYSKLWPAIARLCREMGLPERGHLEQIVCAQRFYLTQYGSRFELSPGQTGALFFVDDKLVGLELAPTPAWFAEVWMPLVCFSYGAHAMPRERQSADPPMPLAASTPAGLRAALHAERRAAELRLWERAAAMPPAYFSADEEERLLDLKLLTVQSDHFSGQVVEQDGRPVYASLAARPEWLSAA
jgi:hypothetical protein